MNKAKRKIITETSVAIAHTAVTMPVLIANSIYKLKSAKSEIR
jgi:hypothetical protein